MESPSWPNLNSPVNSCAARVLSWQAIGREDLDLRQIMEAMMIQVTSGFGGQVVDAKPVIHDGLSGKDAEVTAVDGGQQLSGRMRALYAADRMYLLVWLGPPESYRRDQRRSCSTRFVSSISLPRPSAWRKTILQRRRLWLWGRTIPRLSPPPRPLPS